VDGIRLRNGGLVEGTILEYTYGEAVVMVTEAGETKSFEWEEVLRVNFRIDKSRLVASSAIPPAKKVVVVKEEKKEIVPTRQLPRRKFLHQVSANIGLSTSGQSRFGGNATTIGGGFGYHLVRPVGKFNVGIGVDANIMSYARLENIVATTAMAEYYLRRKGKRSRPFFRMEIGPSIPFGSPDDNINITERKLSILYHPSLGVEFAAPEGKWGALVLDVGYRFLDSRFLITTETLDVIQRNIQYRRLVLRGAIRF